MSEVAGKIVKATSQSGVADLSRGIKKDDLLYYNLGNEQVVVRVTKVESWPYRGPQGHFQVIKPSTYVPPPFTELHYYTTEVERGGVFIEIGKDIKDNLINLRVNSLFRNVLVAGKTQVGKTHLNISVAEQLISKRIPHLIIDTQGEFTNLTGAILARDPDEILASLKERRTVIVDMLTLTDSEKAAILTKILEKIKKEKERDYEENRKTKQRLKYPPFIITVDEIEVYALNRIFKSSPDQMQSGRILATFSKRMVKFGVGLFSVVQQMVRLATDVRSQCNTAILFNMDNPLDLRSIRALRYVTGSEVTLVRGLRRGEFIIVGESVNIPLAGMTLPINTPRTKPTDFEQMLELQSTILRAQPTAETVSAIESIEEDDEEESSNLCPDCGKHTRRITVRNEKLAGKLKHYHFICARCKIEYCTHAQRWLSATLTIHSLPSKATRK